MVFFDDVLVPWERVFQLGDTELVKLARGEHLKLRYGVLLHPGDAREGKVAEHYERFVHEVERIYRRLSPLLYLSRPGPSALLRTGAWRHLPFLLRSLGGFANAMGDLKYATGPGGTLYVFRLP